MSLQLRLTGLTDTGFTMPLSMQTVNKNIYKKFGDADKSSQERGDVIGTTDLLYTWDEYWDLTVDEVVAATGLPADRVLVTKFIYDNDNNVLDEDEREYTCRIDVEYRHSDRVLFDVLRWAAKKDYHSFTVSRDGKAHISFVATLPIETEWLAQMLEINMHCIVTD